jgi:translation initiation factor IF-1
MRLTRLVYSMAKRNKSGKRNRSIGYDFRPDMIYLEGRIIEALPGARFKVRVDRENGLEPLIIDADLRTIYKLRHMHLIKGDFVQVEINPAQDLTKGVIVLVERKMYTPPPKP